jgi:chromosome segregation protein
VRELENRIGEFVRDVAACREELDRPGLAAADGEAEIVHLRQSLEELNAREEMLLRLRDDRRSTGAELSEKLTECRGKIEDMRQRERDCQTQNSRLREGISELARQASECSMRIENIRDRAREELQLEDLSLPGAVPESEAVSEDGGIAAPTAQPEAEAGPAPEWADSSDAELQSRVEELSQKIRNIGSINPEAIDELAELEASAEFLRSHKEEQEEAAASMRTAIDRLNAESSTRFQETFTAVRENFQSMFTRLFGGGKADLILEEVTEPGADPLDAGIDIQAQPPGKEPKSISLLSGGEKALCAVALLFALFRSKPSPFCILDEVDGPLDESNITRFMQLVRDFTSDTQFIIITHSQLTMGMMDSIWGVTQQERGISKVIGLQYAKMEDMSREKVRPEAGEREEATAATA